MKDAPYSADEMHFTELTQRDGTALKQQGASRRLYRDREGRTRTEESLQFLPATPDARLAVVIRDCGAGVEYTLDARNRVAHRSMIPAAAPRTHAAPPSAPTNYQASNESLGTQIIQGVLVEGRRDTLSYPAGTWGYDRPIKTVHEAWMSRELGIPVLSKSSRPPEDVTYKLTNIRRLEPDPLLFVVPADYKIVEESGSFTIPY